LERAPTKYAVLRHGHDWPGATLDRLAVDGRGRIALARLPGVRPPVALEGPWDVSASGLAVAGRQLYLADAAGKIIWLEARCDRRWELAIGGSPRGICASESDLFVAVQGPARIVVVRRDVFDVRAVWSPGLSMPEAVSLDGEGRLYVVDRGAATLVRLTAGGTLDASFAVATADPRFVAVGEDGVVYVADAGVERILRFDASGAALGPLETAEGPVEPRALAIAGDRLYAADAADGRVFVHDLGAARWLGTAAGFVGPATALAVGPGGDLHVKTDEHEAYTVLGAAVGCAPSGSLVSGPHDAGVALAWRRLAAAVEDGGGSHLLELALLPTDTPPAPGDWIAAPADDTLLPPPGAAVAEARYAWVRLGLGSDDGYASPAVEAVQLETPAPSWLEHLPPVYARRDDGTLERWLALFQYELRDMEWLLEAIFRRFDPAQVPADALEPLARWVAWRSPMRAGEAERRELVADAHRIHTRRGTSRGIREAVAREAGIVPKIVAEHAARRLWILGEGALGLDSGLPPADPNGAVVPDPDAVLVVGRMTVGQTGPQEHDDFGEPLFADTAHLFSVLLPAGEIESTAQFELVRDVVQAEKPAHTDFHLCVIEPRMRIGFQARIGIDAIVAGPRAPMVLATRLGATSVLGGTPRTEGPVRVGSFAIGRGARVGPRVPMS
jgi:phage tail-like protein